MKIKKVPLILQMEATECGAASLGMILKFYGKNVPLEKLRIECGVSRDGVNAKNIAMAAKRNELIPSAFRMEPDEVENADFPVIIHWNMEHFVVLYGFSKKGAHIADPALGYTVVPREEFSRSFTGIVLLFKKGENFVEDNSENEKKSSFILDCIKPELAAFIFASLMLMVVSVAGFYTPFFNSVFIDKILMNGNMSNLKLLIQFIIVTLIMVTAALIVYIKIIFFMSRDIEIKINTNFMWKIIKYPIAFFSQRNPGELSNRQSDNMNIAESICNDAVPIPVDIIIILIYLVFFFVFDPIIGIIGLISVVLNVLSVVLSSKALANDMMIYCRDDGVLRGNISSSINMIETIKACGCENEIFQKLSGLGAGGVNLRNNVQKKTAYAHVIFSVINNIMYSAVIVTGVYKILEGDFTVGVLIGIVGIMTAFLLPIDRISDSMQSLQSLKDSINRAEESMNYSYEPIFAEESDNTIDGSIHIDNITFGYNLYAAPLINDFSLDIKKGESVAFMGGSGSGKSTMAKLVAGLYTPQQGHIYYGNATADGLTEKCFYEHIAIVDQNIKLFCGSILENITMWDKNIEYETVIQAAKDACIHDDIMKRSGGYFNEVYAGGRNFSGGQKQKIEIARALAKNPDIIILDEATSALDTAVEAQIMENIKKRGVTLIIIAHRLSTIRDCDNILVMNNGDVIQSGTHEQLMELGGKYAELVSCQ